MTNETARCPDCKSPQVVKGYQRLPITESLRACAIYWFCTDCGWTKVEPPSPTKGDEHEN